jgi:hypothetical protein
MLISESDLPGSEWALRDERVFRLGMLGEQTDWGVRARRSGNFAATRSFAQDSTHSWILTEVLPFVSAEDAILALRNWSTDNMWKNTKFRGELVEEHELADPSGPGVDAVRIFLQETVTPAARGYVLHAVATIDSVLLFVGVSRPDAPVNLGEIKPVIATQAAKIRFLAPRS